tara:strand:- start:14750 stop:15061 length:312 start_codon:yes stop_codon:yes gene_type:complete
MKPVFTKYRVASTWKYRKRYHDDDYAMVIECHPGIIDRVRGHSTYKFAVVGHKGMWYYAKLKENERSYEITEVGRDFIHYSKDRLFNSLFASAKNKGMIKCSD